LSRESRQANWIRGKGVMTESLIWMLMWMMSHCVRGLIISSQHLNGEAYMRKHIPFVGFSKDLIPGRVKLSFFSSSLILRKGCLCPDSPYPSSSASLSIGSKRLCLLFPPCSDNCCFAVRKEDGEVTFGFWVLVGGFMVSDLSAISWGPSTSTFILGVTGLATDWP
jgi:hypothetical protein